jgi:hypothetical protein
MTAHSASSGPLCSTKLAQSAIKKLAAEYESCTSGRWVRIDGPPPRITPKKLSFDIEDRPTIRQTLPYSVG